MTQNCLPVRRNCWMKKHNHSPSKNEICWIRGSLWNYWHPWAFWTLDETKILLIAKGRGKSELVEKERKQVSCLEARRQGRFRAGLWSTAGVNYTHLIKQSTTASSGKEKVLSKIVTELDPTNIRHPSLSYPRLRIKLALDLAIKLNLDGYAV